MPVPVPVPEPEPTLPPTNRPIPEQRNAPFARFPRLGQRSDVVGRGDHRRRDDLDHHAAAAGPSRGRRFARIATATATAVAIAPNRRRAVGIAVGGLGGLLLLLPRLLPATLARDHGDADDHDDGHGGADDSGRGRGRGRGRGGGDDDRDSSGSGNAEEQARIAQDLETAAASLPAGAQLVRIESDDAGGFVPGELTIDRGQSVAFLNGHGDEHTATGSGFDTGIIDSGEIALVVMDAAGSFPYACQIHPEMTGLIRVRNDDGSLPGTPTAASPVPAGADALPVRIADLAFEPARLTVQPGDAVTWTNADGIPHTVTADDRSFDSGIMNPGAAFSHRFDAPGVIAYHCDLHPSMLATVEVVDADAGAAAIGTPAP